MSASALLCKAIVDVQCKDKFGWILLTGTSTNDVRKLAMESVEMSTPIVSHTEECSILTAARTGKTWADVVLESTFRSAVQHATLLNVSNTTTTTNQPSVVSMQRLAVVYLWQLTDFFISKRNSENRRNHVCVQDSDRAARKIAQCYTQLQLLQQQRDIHIIVIATVISTNKDVDVSKILPAEIQSCFHYHVDAPTPDRRSSNITASSNNKDTITIASCVPSNNDNNKDGNNGNIDWGLVVGMETAKQSLLEAVVWSRTRAKEFHHLGVRPSRGILLYGPPGTGKTLVARTVAEKANVTFLSMSFAEIIRSGVGESEAAIAVAFDQARRNGPSVLFIDEIQALFSGRKNAGSVAKKMTSQLLQEIDGLTAKQQFSSLDSQYHESMKDDVAFSMEENHVVVLAATNMPQALDPALLRPGRFDKLIHVGLPNAAGRAQIFRNLLCRKKSKIHPNVVMSPLSPPSLFPSAVEDEMCRYVGSEIGADLTGAEIENIYRIAVGLNAETGRPLSMLEITKAMEIVR